MFQLILTFIALSLVGGLSIITVNYLPSWGPHARDAHVLVETGAKTLINAFDLRAAQNEGISPMPNYGELDQGLHATFAQYYSFLPRAPNGYMWLYGHTPASVLISEAFPGAISDNGTEEELGDDGLFWFCLAPTGEGANEGVYRGMKRAQQVFPETQMYINNLPCGHAINSADPTHFPAQRTLTVFVRYVPGYP